MLWELTCTRGTISKYITTYWTFICILIDVHILLCHGRGDEGVLEGALQNTMRVVTKNVTGNGVAGCGLEN